MVNTFREIPVAEVALAAVLPMCPVCRRRFEPSETGRRQVFCSRRCQSRRERELDHAAAELARDGSRAPVAEQLERAELLYGTWAHDFGGRDGFVGRDLAERFWPGGVPPRTAPPSPKAVSALRKRVMRLRAQAAAEKRRRQREEVRRGEAAVEERLRARREADEAAERAWRRELLRGGDDAA